MFFKECENLASEYKDLKLVSEKLDKYFHDNPTAAIDALKLNKFLSVDPVALENSLNYLKDQGMLTKASAYICISCGGYNEQDPDENILTCLHCDRQLIETTGKTIIFRLSECHKNSLSTAIKHKKLIIFIHGLGGTPEETWEKFPSLLKEYPAINQSYDLAFYSFPTGWGRRIIPWKKGNPEISILADSLATVLSNKYSDYNDIILICHSLGGVIAKKYIVECIKGMQEIKISKLLLYAVPNLGSGLSNIKKIIPWGHYQIKQLCKKSEFLNQLNRDWQNLSETLNQFLNVKYVIGGLDRVVDPNSSRHSWGVDSETIADCGHKDLVKPQNKNDMTILIAKNFIIGATP